VYLEEFKAIRVYDEPDGWVEYVDNKGTICANAHANSGKYTIGMMRAMLKVLDIKGEVVTDLQHDYLIKFYKKHFDTTYLNDFFYIIKRR